MIKRVLSLSILSVVSSAACSSSVTAPPPPDNDVHMTLHYTTQPGQETHWCEYKKLPASPTGEVLIGGAKWSWQNAHHWALYRVLPNAPLAELALDQPFDCFAPLGAMKWAQPASALLQAEPTGETAFPDGTAFPFKSEEIVIVQTHSINTTTKPIDVTLNLQLKVRDAGAVENKLGLIQFYDPYIYVPAHTAATAQMRCKIPQDMTLVRTTTHFHTRGVKLDSFIDGPDGTPNATPFMTSTNWANPPTSDVPVKIAAGSYLRTVCNYMGDDTSPAVQGQQKGNTEMCMTIAYYYPAVDPKIQGAFENCVPSPIVFGGQVVEGFGDSYGTGKATCMDTLGCVQNVLGANPMEAPNPHDGQIDVGPNFQKCIVDSCPSASAPLFRTSACIQTKCKDACGGADPSKCMDCVTASCGPEIGACLAHTCN
jgi:hypothetical protein